MDDKKWKERYDQLFLSLKYLDYEYIGGGQ